MSVTESQKNAIIQLFQDCNWELDQRSIPQQAIGNEERQAEEEEHRPDEPQFIIQMDENAERCPFCLCRPCITDETNRQLWWGLDALVPHHQNRRHRKDCYRRFWTMLYHRRIWQDPEYMMRKVAALGHDPARRQYVYHRRDLMPNCVIKLVRWWYPSHDGQYMGHRWE